jgi:alkaline phosphatase D
VAADDTFATTIAGGTVTPSPDDDHTAKVLVEGLEPDTWYSYRFVAEDGAGPVGRLRTAPSPDTKVERVRFAYCSCQQINDSLYVAHRAMRDEPDLDFFVHLGDYIYVNDQETLTVDDYRDVYHRFKANPLLQSLQATVPIVAMFDDGEYYNGVDSTGDPERLAAGRKAWLEAFPVLAPEDDPERVYRQVLWGDLLDLLMLDVRSYRDPAVEATDTATPDGAVVLEPERTTLGAAQRTWLLDALSTSTRAWKALGNPYNMAMARIADRDDGPPREPGEIINDGVYLPNEAWDDYPVERRTILQHIVDEGVTDVVSVSGHTHIWVAGVMQPDPDDPASPTAAFDVTCGSLTADPNLLDAEEATPEAERARFRALEAAGLELNGHLRYLNFVDQGYALVEVTPEAFVVECKLIDPFDEDAEPAVGARIVIERGATDMTVERSSAAER